MRRGVIAVEREWASLEISPTEPGARGHVHVTPVSHSDKILTEQDLLSPARLPFLICRTYMIGT